MPKADRLLNFAQSGLHHLLDRMDLDKDDSKSLPNAPIRSTLRLLEVFIACGVRYTWAGWLEYRAVCPKQKGELRCVKLSSTHSFSLQTTLSFMIEIIVNHPLCQVDLGSMARIPCYMPGVG